MTIRSVVLSLSILIVLLLASRAVTACTCAPGGSPCESYGSASAVFVGTVTSVRGSERRPVKDPKDVDWVPVAYKFSVDQSYLGVSGTEIEVFTGRGGGDCGFDFQQGQRYLVYAHRYNDKLITSICTRTKPFSQATEDLAFLGTLSSAPPGVTIYGAVMRGPDDGPTRTEIKTEPLSPDIQIVIEGETEKKEIRPDTDGRFRVNGLRPGKYKLALRLPDTLTTSRNEVELSLVDRGCAGVAWYFVDNGRVSGRVINADGEPVARIAVSLVNPGTNATEYSVKFDRTNDEGYFSFSAVPPGNYNIAVNRNGFPELNDPTLAYPPSFYPGVVDQRHAQTITVGAGEKLSDFEVRIPSKRPAAVLTGSVVWADGSPVENAQVSVKDTTYTHNSMNYGVTADGQGQFKIDGYVGQKLRIEARSNRPMERSEVLTVGLERSTQTVRIVITRLR